MIDLLQLDIATFLSDIYFPSCLMSTCCAKLKDIIFCEMDLYALIFILICNIVLVLCKMLSIYCISQETEVPRSLSPSQNSSTVCNPQKRTVHHYPSMILTQCFISWAILKISKIFPVLFGTDGQFYCLSF